MRRSSFGLAAAGLVLAGCAALTFEDVAREPPEPMGGGQGFQDCEPPFVFNGESTMAALGLDDVVGLGPERARRGQVRITRDAIRHEDFAPPGVPAAAPEGQVLCVTWADGSGMATMLPQPWPQGSADADFTDAGEVTLIAPLIGFAVMVVIGVISWMAFRREPPNPS